MIRVPTHRVVYPRIVSTDLDDFICNVITPGPFQVHLDLRATGGHTAFCTLRW